MLMMEKPDDDFTVFLGRGKGCWNAPGNRALHKVVSAYFQAYQEAKTKTEKSNVVDRAVEVVRNSGFRFVRADKPKGKYYEVAKMDDSIRTKVAHQLRDQSSSAKAAAAAEAGYIKPVKLPPSAKRHRSSESQQLDRGSSHSSLSQASSHQRSISNMHRQMLAQMGGSVLTELVLEDEMRSSQEQPHASQFVGPRVGDGANQNGSLTLHTAATDSASMPHASSIVNASSSMLAQSTNAMRRMRALPGDSSASMGPQEYPFAAATVAALSSGNHGMGIANQSSMNPDMALMSHLHQQQQQLFEQQQLIMLHMQQQEQLRQQQFLSWSPSPLVQNAPNSSTPFASSSGTDLHPSIGNMRLPVMQQPSVASPGEVASASDTRIHESFTFSSSNSADGQDERKVGQQTGEVDLEPNEVFPPDYGNV